MSERERGNFFSFLSLLWKDIEGISEEAKQVMKEKIILLRDSSAPVFFYFFFDTVKLESLNVTLGLSPAFFLSHSPLVT